MIGLELDGALLWWAASALAGALVAWVVIRVVAGWPRPPVIEPLGIVRLEPADVILVEVTGRISEENADRIRRQLEQLWPGQKVAVLDESAKVTVLRKSA